MAYQYQSFGSGQVFSAAEAQQIEDNIRDHRHGVDGVGPSGAAWSATSKASAFAVASTDAGTLFKCFGDYAVSFAAAATLGSAFGTAFKNVGSGRIQLNASSGQFIDNHSYYALCPGEGVMVTSDGTELTVVGGQDHVKLQRLVTVGSIATVDLLKLFPGDFHTYELHISANQNGLGTVAARVSVDSGSSFIATGYANNVTGDTTQGVFGNGTSNSRQLLMCRAVFNNSPHVTSTTSAFSTYTLRRGAGLASEDNFFFTTNAIGMLNGLRIANTGGGFFADSVFELYARGRVRR